MNRIRIDSLPRRVASAALMWIAFAHTGFAETPGDRGLEIAREAESRNSGWGDYSADLNMIIRDSGGSETRRELRTQALEQKDEGDMTLLVIEEPPDVRGVALLTHSHPDREDDQWLYLPALKRVKRISGNNQSGSFMGSEFTYEDLAPQKVEQYTYVYLRDEVYNGHSCYVLERTPVDEDSGYKRMVAWLDKEHYRVHKVDYYDRTDRLLKTFTASEFEKYLDRFWRAKALEMTNHQTGASTTLTVTDIAFQQGLTARDFDKNRLDRVL